MLFSHSKNIRKNYSFILEVKIFIFTNDQCNYSEYNEERKICMAKLLIRYQDSVIAFALKYKINGRFIVNLKDCSFEIALFCFMLLLCLYFLLHAFIMQDMLSLFIFFFLPRIIPLLQNNYFLSHFSQRTFASPFSTLQ